jgi:ComEC/Rec2-related protein
LERLYAGDSDATVMMQAILIGETAGLQRAWTEGFRRTGTFHALVISGVHVTVLAGVLLFLLRLCAFPELRALAATAAATWLYALVSGLSAPVVRAAGGFSLYLAARFLFRRTRVMNLLAAITIAYLLWDPYQLFDASFQLSFLSVAAIGALAAPLLEPRVLCQPWPAPTPPGTLELTTIDVGQGDSHLLVFPGGKSMQVDGGGILQFGRVRKTNLDIGEDVVSPYLWTRGIRQLDVVVETHAHEDPIGGLPALPDNFRPKELWTGANASPSLSERTARLGVRVLDKRARDALNSPAPRSKSCRRRRITHPGKSETTIHSPSGLFISLHLPRSELSFRAIGQMDRGIHAPSTASATRRV